VREAVKALWVPKKEKFRLRKPRLNSLPKIHETGIPLRPIVNAVSSPTQPAARYIEKKVQPFSGLVDSYIRDSRPYIEKIRNEEGNILVSINIESIFTNLLIPEQA
jgi:hypothetical protein